jgi:hypothetical protein
MFFWLLLLPLSETMTNTPWRTRLLRVYTTGRVSGEALCMYYTVFCVSNHIHQLFFERQITSTFSISFFRSRVCFVHETTCRRYSRTQSAFATPAPIRVFARSTIVVVLCIYMCLIIGRLTQSSGRRSCFSFPRLDWTPICATASKTVCVP